MPLVENQMQSPTGAALTKDAVNRAARTAYVQLVIDVGVAVALLLGTYFVNKSNWDEIDWKILGFSLLKTVISTIGSFLLRRFVDPSGIPTPLPPAPVPAPNDDSPKPPADGGAVEGGGVPFDQVDVEEDPGEYIKPDLPEEPVQVDEEGPGQ